MKKTLTYLFILVVSVVLSGCSIPLGDLGTLDISKDGVNVTTDGTLLDLGGEDEDEGEKVAVDSGVEAVDEEDEDDEVEKDDGKKAESPGTSASSSYVCNELVTDQKGNDRALKKLRELLSPGFHLVDCIFIESVEEGYYDSYQAVTLDTFFQVDGYWADVFDEYVELLNDAGFGPLKLSEDTKRMSGSIDGNTPDYRINMQFSQRDLEDVEVTRIRIYLYHYDEPRE